MTTLHAQATNTTLYCYKNTMKVNTVSLNLILTDYNGDQITDYNGDIQISYEIDTDLAILHAPETSTTLHTEK